jgi:hypothetical protein
MLGQVAPGEGDGGEIRRAKRDRPGGRGALVKGEDQILGHGSFLVWRSKRRDYSH